MKTLLIGYLVGLASWPLGSLAWRIWGRPVLDRLLKK